MIVPMKKVLLLALKSDRDACLDKLRELRTLIDGLGKEILLEVDGGVHAGNIEEIKAAGADVIVAGSAVFNAENRAEMIAKLKA